MRNHHVSHQNGSHINGRRRILVRLSSLDVTPFANGSNGSLRHQVKLGVTKADRPGYTVAMVEKALRLYDAKGREATVAYYNSPQSVDGQWYVFIVDENDQLIAHANPDMLGEDLTGDLGVDITGYRHGEVIASATEEGMWVDYSAPSNGVISLPRN